VIDQIIEVNSPQLMMSFVDLPKRLYKNDENYIMPLDIDILNTFDRNYNPEFKTGDCKQWLLQRNGQYIGRIAAFYNVIKNSDVKTAGCGFFECINDQSAANTLFDTAKNWLKEQGCTYMDGPINFGDRDSFWGLMVEGFASPAYRENYNFPYYKELFENYGFVSEIGQTTSLIDEKSFNFERFSKLASRVFANESYTFDYFKLSKIEKYAEDFVEIYNKAWAFHENFVPMTKEKILVRMNEMKPIVVEDLNVFAYHDGQPVGFYLTVLDVNQIFKHVKGKMNLIGKLKFLYYRTKVKRIRGIVFGVIPEFQNKGLEVAMIMKFRESLRKGGKFTENELAWIGDFNPKMLSMFESMGAQPIKRHITYRFNF
jgi:GNAT superfamily N-acetyltransferase